jgi:hypothetical protein
VYPCRFPGCLTQKRFNRSADLDRHYRNVHASEDQREHFECDYPKCDRARDPFTRKDHYRDHLRDYHKEDLGQAKGAKRENPKKWEQAQKAWLAERNIKPYWWRCAKCLSRVQVREEGWECRKCNMACESERKASRDQMMTEGPTANSYELAAACFLDCSTCNGTGWTKDGHRGWAACPNCDPTAGLSEPSYYADTWINDNYNISYSSY